ncbi:MAG: DUF2163 domain-containing protein [Pseudotabrizicola sp.]|uniref:DUF2163 domain-containing protein n=1 Tax=Pseudotabrizicola sp. TaxID=2939647 RepID=UPI002725413F|nr:DUF2163 domain-containing protein [Pseudotabrizicola sp.]MDO9638799.1 DUF2163 domain-containing protein [Pseudotabrizicola sp.]
MQDALKQHLKSGSTTVCRTWLVRRKDGETYGFTDHDCDLNFDGVVFAARTGMTAGVLEKSTGMAVDNTEVMGALSDASIREEDILAGRYDGAEVTTYLVNWADVTERSILFRGTFGEMIRSGGAFRVELRGLTEKLNVPHGRVYHPECGAVLGDGQCRIDLSAAAFTREGPLQAVIDGRILHVPADPSFAEGWFVDGQAVIQSGAGKGQVGRIKADSTVGDVRIIELWQTFSVRPMAPDQVRLIAGCDRRASTCRQKFNNFLNFRGFPHIPGEDWLRSSPDKSVGR